MTTELEQKFYDTFGIEKQMTVKVSCTPEYLEHCEYYKHTEEYKGCTKLDYPDITAEKLLEMICIILNVEGLLTINTEGNIADIKDFVLRFLISKVNNNPYCHYKTKNKIKQQIQQLFKDEQ